MKPAGEEGESPRSVLPVAERAEARDFRRPWAEDGRPGEAEPLGDFVDSEGGEGDHGFPANVASSLAGSQITKAWYQMTSHLFPILGSSPTMVRIMWAHAFSVTSLVGGSV